jgi:hypothetical protein
VVQLNTPLEYGEQKDRFVSLVKSLYLIESNQLTKERAAEYARRLVVEEDKACNEISLEAIGTASIERLTILLNASDEEVRFRAGRCLLNLGNDAGAEAVRETAMTGGPPYRIEALEAMTRSGKHNDAVALARRLLRDEDFTMRLAAYESLRKLGDVSIRQEGVAHDFLLEQVTGTMPKCIYAYRSGRPRIVLMGAPLTCKGDIFIQTDNGSVTINAPVGQEYLSIMRRHPTKPSLPPISAKSSFDVADMINRMCESAVVQKDSGVRPGLEIPYSDALDVLKKMCQSGAIEAEFRAGPLTKVELLMK